MSLIELRREYEELEKQLKQLEAGPQVAGAYSKDDTRKIYQTASRLFKLDYRIKYLQREQDLDEGKTSLPNPYDIKIKSTPATSVSYDEILNWEKETRDPVGEFKKHLDNGIIAPGKFVEDLFTESEKAEVRRVYLGAKALMNYLRGKTLDPLARRFIKTTKSIFDLYEGVFVDPPKRLIMEQVLHHKYGMPWSETIKEAPKYDYSDIPEFNWPARFLWSWTKNVGDKIDKFLFATKEWDIKEKAKALLWFNTPKYAADVWKDAQSKEALKWSADHSELTNILGESIIAFDWFAFPLASKWARAGVNFINTAKLTKVGKTIARTADSSKIFSALKFGTSGATPSLDLLLMLKRINDPDLIVDILKAGGFKAFSPLDIIKRPVPKFFRRWSANLPDDVRDLGWKTREYLVAYYDRLRSLRSQFKKQYKLTDEEATFVGDFMRFTRGKDVYAPKLVKGMKPEEAVKGIYQTPRFLQNEYFKFCNTNNHAIDNRILHALSDTRVYLNEILEDPWIYKQAYVPPPIKSHALSLDTLPEPSPLKAFWREHSKKLIKDRPWNTTTEMVDALSRTGLRVWKKKHFDEILTELGRRRSIMYRARALSKTLAERRKISNSVEMVNVMLRGLKQAKALTGPEWTKLVARVPFRVPVYENLTQMMKMLQLGLNPAWYINNFVDTVGMKNLLLAKKLDLPFDQIFRKPQISYDLFGTKLEFPGRLGAEVLGFEGKFAKGIKLFEYGDFIENWGRNNLGRAVYRKQAENLVKIGWKTKSAIHENAYKAALDVVGNTHFHYLDMSTFDAVARNIWPYWVWNTRNFSFWTQQIMDHPFLASRTGQVLSEMHKQGRLDRNGNLVIGRYGIDPLSLFSWSRIARLFYSDPRVRFVDTESQAIHSARLEGELFTGMLHPILALGLHKLDLIPDQSWREFIPFTQLVRPFFAEKKVEVPKVVPEMAVPAAEQVLELTGMRPGERKERFIENKAWAYHNAKQALKEKISYEDAYNQTLKDLQLQGVLLFAFGGMAPDINHPEYNRLMQLRREWDKKLIYKWQRQDMIKMYPELEGVLNPYNYEVIKSYNLGEYDRLDGEQTYRKLINEPTYRQPLIIDYKDDELKDRIRKDKSLWKRILDFLNTIPGTIASDVDAAIADVYLTPEPVTDEKTKVTKASITTVPQADIPDRWKKPNFKKVLSEVGLKGGWIKKRPQDILYHADGTPRARYQWFEGAIGDVDNSALSREFELEVGKLVSLIKESSSDVARKTWTEHKKSYPSFAAAFGESPRWQYFYLDQIQPLEAGRRHPAYEYKLRDVGEMWEGHIDASRNMNEIEQRYILGKDSEEAKRWFREFGIKPEDATTQDWNYLQIKHARSARNVRRMSLLDEPEFQFAKVLESQLRATNWDPDVVSAAPKDQIEFLYDWKPETRLRAVIGRMHKEAWTELAALKLRGKAVSREQIEIMPDNLRNYLAVTNSDFRKNLQVHAIPWEWPEDLAKLKDLDPSAMVDFGRDLDRRSREIEKIVYPREAYSDLSSFMLYAVGENIRRNKALSLIEAHKPPEQRKTISLAATVGDMAEEGISRSLADPSVLVGFLTRSAELLRDMDIISAEDWERVGPAVRVAGRGAEAYSLAAASLASTGLVPYVGIPLAVLSMAFQGRREARRAEAEEERKRLREEYITAREKERTRADIERRMVEARRNLVYQRRLKKQVYEKTLREWVRRKGEESYLAKQPRWFLTRFFKPREKQARTWISRPTYESKLGLIRSAERELRIKPKF